MNPKQTLFFTTLIFLFAAAESIRGQSERLEKSAPIRSDSSLSWYDIRDLGVQGRGWQEPGREFERLPAKAQVMVPKNVWGLSRHSAGLYVQFTTDADEIQARWVLTKKDLALPHMPATGVSGLDLYVKTEAGWRWAGAGRPTDAQNSKRLLGGLPPGVRTFRLYLPLYNGVSTVEIGIPRDASLWRLEKETPGLPIVFYGTSITQGGCASRPGMSAVAILGRRLNMPVINLGFSGNGKMEAELAMLLAEIDASLYVIDCLPNMNVELVEERVEPFVEILRQARPETPILLVEERDSPRSFLFPQANNKILHVRGAMRRAYENLTAKGVKNLHYLYGYNQLGDDGEGTVDGSHPTDLGFMRQADAFEPAIRSILLLETEKEK